MEMETISYSYESRSLAEQVSMLEALGLDLLLLCGDDKSKTQPLHSKIN